MGKIHGSLTRKVAKQDKKKKPRGSADNRLQDLDGLKMIQQSETSLIPMEVVIEDILTRLPVKSLMRFKCVSKLWSSLISSRYFRNRFVKESRRLRFYLSLQDLKKQRHSVTLSMEADTSSSCFVVDHDLTIPMMGDSDLEYLAPGFICFTFLNHPRIFNPATRQLVTLPHPNIILPPRRRHNRVFVHYYYGYDPLMDKYTVLCSKGEDSESLISIRSEHHVLTIKAAAAAAAGGFCGGLWTMAAPTQPDFRPHVPIEGGVCIDGVLYYIGWTGGPAALVSYNTRSLDFEMLQLPRDEVPTWYLSLVVYSGKPTIIDYTRLRKKGMLDLWHLGKHDKSSCWFKETLVLQPCQLHLVKTNVLYDIKGTTQNGLLFLVPDDWFCPFHILCYDLQNNHLRKIEIKGVPDRWSKKLKHNVGVGYAFLCDDFSNVMFTDRSDDNHMYLY